jgi:hypothetical protein
MKINKEETKIVGHWIFDGSKMTTDEACKRIESLVAGYLIKITTDGGWDILYQDPEDKRYWELIYPNSEMHGGGPPSLILLSEVQVKEKYHI